MKCRLNQFLVLAVVFILVAAPGSLMELEFRQAGWSGDTEKVKVLLVKGADVNAKDCNGTTALMGAAVGGHTDTVEVLLANGADVNAKRESSGTTALMQAKKMGYKEIVRMLKQAGAKE